MRKRRGKMYSGRKKRRITAALILFSSVLLLITLALSFAVRGRAELADLISQRIGRPVRRVLSVIGRAVPVCAAELLLFLSLPLTVLAVRRAVGLEGRGRARLVAALSALLSVLYSCFFFTLGVGYHGRGVGEKMGFEISDVLSAEELYTLCRSLGAQADSLGPQEPTDFGEVCRRLDLAYAELCNKYLFIDSLRSTPRALLANRLWTRLGVMGFYSYCFGQTAVNTAFPAFQTAYTAAHEMAHQRGVSREDEANFIAYLALTGSEDGYLRYCGYAGMLEYALCALADVSPPLFAELYDELPEGVRGDIDALWALVRESCSGEADRLADAVNDAYLKGNGTEGRVSYGYALRLLAGYMNSRN